MELSLLKRFEDQEAWIAFLRRTSATFARTNTNPFIIRIQAWTRSVAARARWKVKLDAGKVLNRTARRVIAKQCVSRLREGATVLQRLWNWYALRKPLKKLVTNVTVVQRFRRSLQVRRRFRAVVKTNHLWYLRRRRACRIKIWSAYQKHCVSKSKRFKSLWCQLQTAKQNCLSMYGVFVGKWEGGCHIAIDDDGNLIIKDRGLIGILRHSRDDDEYLFESTLTNDDNRPCHKIRVTVISDKLIIKRRMSYQDWELPESSRSRRRPRSRRGRRNGGSRSRSRSRSRNWPRSRRWKWDRTPSRSRSRDRSHCLTRGRILTRSRMEMKSDVESELESELESDVDSDVSYCN